MHRLIAFCVFLATAAEALPSFAGNAAWSNMADSTHNNMMYFVETKQELFVIGAVPDPISKPGPVWTDTTSAPTDTTSAPTDTTRAPTGTTSAPTGTTSAPTAPTSAPTTPTSAPTDTTIAPSDTTPFTAPLGYTYSSETGSFYKYHKELMTWPEANTTCANEGGYLVIINDEMEAAVIGKIIRAANKWWTWTGLIDKRPGGVSDWRSIHGEPISLLYHNWFEGRPLNEADRIYAPMHADKLDLIDHGDGTQLRFTCEISQ